LYNTTPPHKHSISSTLCLLHRDFNPSPKKQPLFKILKIFKNSLSAVLIFAASFRDLQVVKACIILRGRLIRWHAGEEDPGRNFRVGRPSAPASPRLRNRLQVTSAAPPLNYSSRRSLRLPSWPHNLWKKAPDSKLLLSFHFHRSDEFHASCIFQECPSIFCSKICF